MRPLCSRTGCSKSKGGALAWHCSARERRALQHTLAAIDDRSWPKCHFGPMAPDLSLTGRDQPKAANRTTRKQPLDSGRADVLAVRQSIWVAI